jgi:hypothetical protein
MTDKRHAARAASGRPALPTDADAPHLAIPEIDALRELRRALARGGIPPLGKRTPEDSARVAAFYAVLMLWS